MKRNSLFLVLMGVMVIAPALAYAIGPATTSVSQSTTYSSQGEVDFMVASFYCDVRGVISGTIGTLIGLVVSMAGLYSYLMSRSGYGFFFFIAGVAFTGLPGLFDWYFKGMVTAFGDAELHDRKGYTAADNEDVATLDEWCEGITINKVSSSAPGTVKKSVDTIAMQAIGLHSLLDNESVYKYKSVSVSGTLIKEFDLK
ncbi:MAG: hypothetical protein VX154_08095 [Pseudomonadota bacterium]|nr:hypothetical protein [Pseudomonadota bacterium]